MGKRLQTKFSDINNRIIKRTRRDASTSNPYRVTTKLKRKSSTNIVEPLEKISKKDLTDENHLVEVVDNGNIARQTECVEDNICVELLPNSMNIVLKTREKAYNDLFFSEELEHCILNLLNRDIFFHIVDEISLEGLDGITIEAFWKRFCRALDNIPHINSFLKNFIWQNVIIRNNNLKIYELPVARKELEIYNRFDYMNTDIGVVMELAYDLPDIYAPKPVADAQVLGSCSTFNERVDISSSVTNLTLDEAEEKYGLKLVIVANQNLRTYTLCGDQIDPLIEFLITEYALLERIGRSRKHGELTQGRMSVGTGFNMDARSVFHYKKQLQIYDLISSQFFYIKSTVMDHNKTGCLLHLKRFFTNIRTHQCVRADEIMNILKAQPNYRMESKKLKNLFNERGVSISKLLKNPDLRRFVKLKVYPYKTIYPKAGYYEYIHKNGTERMLTFFELANPYINILAYWRTGEHEESDDEDEDKEEELSGQLIYNMDTLRNIYYQLYLKGEQGSTTGEVGNLIGLTKNTVRQGLKKLVGKGILKSNKTDIGKTRKFVYTVRFPKNPNEQLSNNASKTEDEKPKVSSVKARILERQRLALTKKRQESSNNPERVEQPTILNNNFLQIAKPDISNCKFLIKDFDISFQPNPVSSSILEECIYLTKMRTVDLTFLDLNKNQLFNINEILEQILPNLRTPSIKQNIENVFIKKHSNKCMETTILLLKATLGEIIIKKKLFEEESTKETSVLIPDLNKSAFNLSSHSEQIKMDYMGENPLVEFYQQDSNATIELIASTVPEKYNFEKKYVMGNDNTLTPRTVIRLQIILDLVNEKKVVEEIYKLNRLIVEIETKSGYDKKLDRRSLFRIIKRLVIEGYVKVYKLVLFNESINKTVLFICHPSVKHTDDKIKTACQQIRWKYFTGGSKMSIKPNLPVMQKKLQNTIGKSPFSQVDVLNSISEMRKLSRIVIKDLNKTASTTIGRVYGAKPRFTRMRIMHEFLFYLIYHYTGFNNPMPRDEIQQLFKGYRIELSETDLEEMPDIYSKEISWKTFIPPLPVHTGWPSGWALVCDIILRLPISVLLKIHNCTFEDSELFDILNHPVKRLFLVKDLPERIRKTVLYKRKYLYDVHETINRLVFCGLVQFGPQMYKEKDLVFIYLNRRASLRDTRSSTPGYNEVEKKDYPMLPFYFNTSLDVEQYWQMLNVISINTKLNTREAGKIVTLTYINSKTEIIQSVKAKTTQEAAFDDNGKIPGDGMGASGLDSSLWSHLIRNWYWSSKGKNNPDGSHLGLKNEALVEEKGPIKSFKDLESNSIPSFCLPSTSFNKTNKKFVKKPEVNPNNNIVRRLGKYTRVIPKRKGNLSRREYSDEIDRKILKKLGIRRAIWDEEDEEEHVMLCKIGDIIMNGAKKYKKQIVNFLTVRDVLHRISPKSKYKTSRAIQRHWVKMQKSNYIGLEEKVVNLFKLKPIEDTILPLLNRVGVIDDKTSKPFKLTDAQLSAAYIILMSYIVRNRKRILDALDGNLVQTDHLSQENLNNTEETAVEIDPKEIKYFDATNETDVKKDIVKSVIHSSLCSKGITNFSNQLLKIYQNYSDALIKQAVKELRDSNTISYRRWKDRKARIWDTPFSLSQFYIFFQYSTFSTVTAEEAFYAFEKITKHGGNGIEGSIKAVQNKRYGQLLGIGEFFSFYPEPELVFYWPQNTITLNPDIGDHDELVAELALRYQLKLKERNEADGDFETEGENYRRKSLDQELTPIDEDRDSSELTNQTKSVPNDNQEVPLDLTVDGGNSETINRLKTWISNCMTAESERRSPSPEFMVKDLQDEPEGSTDKLDKNIEDDCEEFDVAPKEISTVDKNVRHIPTLDEIKEGMLKPMVDNEERTIPHITELSDLLTKNFTDLKMDANDLVRFKSHFIHEYAALDRLVVDESLHVQDHYMIKYLDSSMRNKKMWERIENDIIIKDFLMLADFEELIRFSGGTALDVELASDIIQFAASKEFLGVTAKELKERFSSRVHNYSLTGIIKNLIEAGILLQVGIVTLAFVHYRFQYAWVVEREGLAVNEPSTSKAVDVVKGAPKSVRMKIMPWVRVNGHIDKSVLKNWMANILSYSLDFPKVTFAKLSDKFCYIKPVDVYYILQILEELGCVELFIYEKQDEDLFTDWCLPQKRYATFLDNLEDIVVQPHNISMTCLGSFFCSS